MNFLILHAHWNNRGDEAALRAMVDNLLDLYPDSKFKIQFISKTVKLFPYEQDKRIEWFKTDFDVDSIWKRRFYDKIIMAYLSKGRYVKNKELQYFIESLKWCNIVIHAPGGPSIGEIYKEYERFYLWRFLFAKRLNKPYMFYAPSAGPFTDKVRNIFRRYVYNNAEIISVREKISQTYIKQLGVKNEVFTTLDSALQRDIDSQKEEKNLYDYMELHSFLKKFKRIIGITISDLTWNSLYRGNTEIIKNISDTFKRFINYLQNKQYGIVFIPQLFGQSNDYKYMKQFEKENCFTMDDMHDCYFQQYVIQQLYAVVGMRYHSNVFSAKMGTPFVSISYEQKMRGFMDKIELDDYCLDVKELNFESLKSRFELLESHYEEIKKKLNCNHDNYKKESYKTTEYLNEVIKRIEE